MNKINKILITLLLVITGTGYYSCDNILDFTDYEDPNGLPLELTTVDRLMNTIQVNFKSFVEGMGDKGAELTRIYYMRGRNYINNYDATSSNGVWDLAYQNMFSDMDEIMNRFDELAISNPDLVYNKQLGVIKTLKAFTLMTLVDYFGDIPYSQVGDYDTYPNPVLDDDAEIYQIALTLLDEAKEHFQSEGPDLANDLYYNNNFDKWIKLVNTLKMQAYLNTRLVDANAYQKFMAIVNEGNYIQTPTLNGSDGDDFEMKYGTNLTNPNTRHPDFNTDYTRFGANSYRSNWLMWIMNNNNDPRIRYYFSRQTGNTPGQGVSSNHELLPCSDQLAPVHYPSDMVFCGVENGYWGRDHGNDEGIPPDNYYRTIVGVYPAGGRFDKNSFTSGKEISGAQGAGITPIMLASWVDFMIAEMKMANSDITGAAQYMESGINKSISKVQSFLTKDKEYQSNPDAYTPYIPSDTEVADFVNNTMTEFNNAGNDEDRWNSFGVQHFIAHYGNGIMAYNFYRRTGYPSTLQPSLEPNPGNFIRSFLYPANEANLNTNVPQKPNVDQQVFWDNNPPSPGFPYSN